MRFLGIDSFENHIPAHTAEQINFSLPSNDCGTIQLLHMTQDILFLGRFIVFPYFSISNFTFGLLPKRKNILLAKYFSRSMFALESP